MGCCCAGSKPPSPYEVLVTGPDTSNPPLPTPPTPRIVVGIHQFRATDAKDLSFNKGDRMIVVEETNERWIVVEHMSSMRRGFVPVVFVAQELSLESYDWFFGNISRKEAEIYLLGDETQPIGTYLVRISENRQGYSLSVKDFSDKRGNHAKHFIIKRTNKGRFFIVVSQEYKGLPELILAYSDRSGNYDSLLTTPCKKPEPDIGDLFYRDKWEIDRDEIRILEELGSGNFGKVFRGIWKNKYEVAVKTLKVTSSPSKDEFLKEAAIMKTFRHRRLVQLYGVCTIGEPFYIIQEYMEHGSLQNYLRQDKGREVKFDDLIFIAFQVASGMEHIELINYVHRDLAARNVLLGPNHLAKIGDFGLARIRNKQGYCIEGGDLPIKWSAPEVFTKNIFTIKSDIWSYGILLMELFTYGETPYKDLPLNVVMKMVSDGRRMPKPKDHYIPDQIYNSIMLQCWQAEPEVRPSFKYLTGFFEAYHTPRRSYEDYLPERRRRH